MRFLTCRCDLPQKLQRSCSVESGVFATPRVPLVRLDDPVDDAVLLRLLGAHEEVPVGVLGDLLERLAGVLGDDLVELPAHHDDLARVDLVCRLLLEKKKREVAMQLAPGCHGWRARTYST